MNPFPYRSTPVFRFALLVGIAAVLTAGCGPPAPKKNAGVAGTNVSSRQDELLGPADPLSALLQQVGPQLQAGEWDAVIVATTPALACVWQGGEDEQQTRKLAELVFVRGQAFLAKGFPQIAVEDFDDAIVAGDDELKSAAYLQRARANMALRRWPNSVEDCTESIRIRPGNADAFLVRGRALEKMGQTDRARQSFVEAQRLDPQLVAELPPTVVQKPPVVNYVGEASLALDNGNPMVARQLLETAIESGESGVESQLLLARSMYELNDYDSAITASDRALNLDPLQAESYRIRGLSWLERGHVDLAISDFSAAIALDNSLQAILEEPLAEARRRGGLNPAIRSAAADEIRDSIAAMALELPNDLAIDRWLAELMALSSSTAQTQRLEAYLDGYQVGTSEPLNWLADFLMLDRWVPGVKSLRAYISRESEQRPLIQQRLWEAVATPATATRNGVNLFPDLAAYAINYRYPRVLEFCLTGRVCNIKVRHLYQAIECESPYYLNLLMPAAQLRDRDAAALLEHCMEQNKPDHARLILANDPEALTQELLDFLGMSGDLTIQ